MLPPAEAPRLVRTAAPGQDQTEAAVLHRTADSTRPTLTRALEGGLRITPSGGGGGI